MAFASTNVVVLVTPAEDVPGQWIAHCLNVDVVTQGDSVQHAFMMAQEAIVQVVEDDVRQGFNPLDRKSAPAECWDVVRETLQHGTPMESIEDSALIVAAVGYVRVTVPRAALPAHARPAEPEVDLMPPAWQVAAIHGAHDSAAPC
jgi:predicted RNase H-like HicB family nuclease